MISAAIFDMDGTLIDSEPLWQKAQIEVLGDLGIPITIEMCREIAGMRIDETLQHFYNYKAWVGKSIAEVESAILEQVVFLISQEGEMKPGVIALIELLRSYDLKIALATSSQFIVIDAVLKRLGLTKEFEVIHSAEQEVYGKPHPAIYLSTAKTLNVKPFECIVFEDALFGVISAKSARMNCVAIPDPYLDYNHKFAIADLIIPSLVNFTEPYLSYFINKKQ